MAGTSLRHCSVITAPAVTIATTVRGFAAATARIISTSMDRTRRLSRSPPVLEPPTMSGSSASGAAMAAASRAASGAPLAGGNSATSLGSLKISEPMYSPSSSAVYPTNTTAASDAAVVFVGYTAEDEGEYIGSEIFSDPRLVALFPPANGAPEAARLAAAMAAPDADEPDIVGGSKTGGDRESLRVRSIDVEMIRAVAAANPRTVVAIVTAGAVMTEQWRSEVPAILLSWYSGLEGGNALADVLFGHVDASGRLPFSIPTSEDHLPAFDRNATTVRYDKWFGQRLLDRLGVEPAFPLGHGLSYTSFALSDATVSAVNGENFTASVSVTNSGRRDGRHVIQIYGCAVDAGDDFPTRVLLGFAPVTLTAAETRRVTIGSSIRPLQRWEPSLSAFTPASSRAIIEVASFAGDPEALSATIELPGTTIELSG